jgi:hypothetical protein
VFLSDDFTHPSSILQFTAAAERRGIKPDRLAPNKQLMVIAIIAIIFIAFDVRYGFTFSLDNIISLGSVLKSLYQR